MQKGIKDRVKIAIMLLVAIAAAYLAGAGFSPGQGTRTQPSNKHEITIAKSAASVELDLSTVDEKIEYSGSGRNIFKKVSYSRPRPPQPPDPPQDQEQAPAILPSIDLKFFGFATRVGDAMRVFLTEGEEVFVASEGEIVKRRYRIVRIGPSWVQIEDVLTSHSENIPLTQG
jgi:hypothetical protein